MRYITIKLDYGRIEENAKMAVELDKLVSNSGYFYYMLHLHIFQLNLMMNR